MKDLIQGRFRNEAEARGFKTCSTCKVIRPKFCFGVNNRHYDKLTYRCKECINSQNRDYSKQNPKILEKAKKQYKENKRKYRNWELKRTFNITIEDYELMLVKQNNVCKLCEKAESNKNRKTLSVDHCHSSGKVRGLLCSNCNLGLGNFKDNINVITKAINYLEENNGKETQSHVSNRSI